jgi:two-component system, NtrC family, response regulator AtoC
MNKTVLICDDDKKISDLIEFRLKRQGCLTHCVYKGADAIDYVKHFHPELVMLDIRLPDINGVEVLKEIKKTNKDSTVLMISAHADVKLAVECMKHGAYDFLEKPFENTELDTKVKNLFERFELQEEVTELRKELGEKYKSKALIGSSRPMKKVFEQLEMAARSNVNVLIEGESGTGKELVARAIHFNGSQKQGGFIAVNCGAIPENLLESELFGHEKGSFTGAVTRKIGKFEQAQGGTIFLDEIGDLSNPLQVKLLRVLQEREIERVGGGQPIPISVRFVAATHRDLKKQVRDGKFREDLYFRLNVFPIRLPALRDRREDIPELLRYFILKHNKEQIKIDGQALERLIEYHWPGNIRELENFVERIILLKGDRDVLTEEDINFLDDLNNELHAIEPDGDGVKSFDDANKIISDNEKSILENALKKANGNVSMASKYLNISRDTFYRKMKKYEIDR